MALFWVFGLILLLMPISFALCFVTSSTHKCVARALAAEGYGDLCRSALDEAGTTMQRAILERKAIGTVDFRQALGPAWPFGRDEKGAVAKPLAIEVPATIDLARELFSGAQVFPVTVEAVGRDAPDSADPLVGAVDLVARVKGKLGGVRGGLVLRRRLVFTVGCTVLRLNGPIGELQRIHWGKPELYLEAAAEQAVLR